MYRALTALLLVACGGDTTDFPAVAAGHACDYLEACQPYYFEVDHGDDRATCEEHLAASYEAPSEDCTLLEDRAEACLAALESAAGSCTEPAHDDCDTAWQCPDTSPDEG